MAKKMKKKAAKPKAARRAAKPARKAGGARKAARRAVAKPARRIARRGSGPRPAAKGPDTKRAVKLLRFSREWLTKVLNDIPADKLTAQPSPTDNHALWTMGHLAYSYQWFLSALGESYELPESFKNAFGTGSKPMANAWAYPPVEEVRHHYDRSFEQFAAAAERLSGAAATAAPAVETGGFANDKLELIERCSWHDAWHAGQVSSLRRAFGMAPLMA